MKVQFELTPLPDDDNYPHEALQCSTTAVEILQLLQAEVENARNQSMLYIQLTFSSCHYLIDYILVQMYLPINNQKSLTSYANRLMKIASFSCYHNWTIQKPSGCEQNQHAHDKSIKHWQYIPPLINSTLLY